MQSIYLLFFVLLSKEQTVSVLFINLIQATLKQTAKLVLIRTLNSYKKGGDKVNKKCLLDNKELFYSTHCTNSETVIFSYSKGLCKIAAGLYKNSNSRNSSVYFVFKIMWFKRTIFDGTNR